MKNKMEHCPKCGYPDVWVGALEVECGYDKMCENWTNTQALEVETLLEQRRTQANGDCQPNQMGLDWDPSEDDTNPIFPIPDFISD